MPNYPKESPVDAAQPRRTIVVDSWVLLTLPKLGPEPCLYVRSEALLPVIRPQST